MIAPQSRSGTLRSRSCSDQCISRNHGSYLLQKCIKPVWAKQQEKQTLLESEQISSYQRQIDHYRSENLTLTTELETFRRQNSEESSAASILRQKVSSLEKQVEHYRSQDDKLREKLQKSEMSLQKEKTSFAARENQEGFWLVNNLKLKNCDSIDQWEPVI